MAKRHSLVPGDWESLFGRLEELVLANSGEDDFAEIFKLVVAKLLSELDAGAPAFATGASPAETGARINRLLAQACNRWPGIIPDSPLSRLTDEHLHVCVEAIARYSLLDANVEALDGAFEYLVSRSAKGAKGQYFTPRNVIDACVRIVDPQSDELVIDPACGSGGFLVHALNHVQRSSNVDPVRYSADHLWGSDFDGRAVQVAKALMLIAGDGSSNLFRLNSLITESVNQSLFGMQDDEPQLTIEDVVRSRIRRFRGFDVILTNPPFAGEVREPQLLAAYELSRPSRRMERDILFLERCVRLLRPGGRLAIVLPHNKLGSLSWAYARGWLLEHLQVVAVLGLARNTFLPHTAQKAAVLFARRREKPLRTRGDETILFLVSDEAGKDSKGRIIARENSRVNTPMWNRARHDLEPLVADFHQFVTEHSIPWRPN